MNKILMMNRTKLSTVYTSGRDPSYKRVLFSPILHHRAQGIDPTMASPSIALLQERFRHLEKVKERREEKELLKLFSETERPSSAPIMHSETSKLSFRSETIAPRIRSNLQDPLSLGLNLQTKQHDLRDRKMPPLTNLWPPNGTAGTASTSRSCCSEINSDVDTSLHL